MTFGILFFLIFGGGWVFARIFERARLPGVMGMTVFGVALGAVTRGLGIAWPDGFREIEPFVTSLALVIILLRAGLGISRHRLNEVGLTAGLLSFLPGILEGASVMVLLHLLFGFSWPVAGMTAFMIAAVSPAVVVPSMLALQAQGRGQQRGVITAILAGASIDDVFAISVFTVFLGMARESASVAAEGSAAATGSVAATGSAAATGSVAATGNAAAFVPLAQIPLVLGGGVLIGLVVGLALAWWFRRGHGAIRATEKALLLIASALLLLEVGNQLHVAALLGVMTMGLIMVERAELAAHELAMKLGKIWIAAQLALFVMIGLSLEVSAVLDIGPRALLVLSGGLFFRSVGVILATAPSRMTWRERLFCVIAYLPKATVQAALGGVALANGIAEGQTILAIAVLAIVVTAPIGLIGIRWSAPHLLAD